MSVRIRLDPERMRQMAVEEAERKARRRFYRNLVLAFLAVAFFLSLMVMG